MIDKYNLGYVLTIKSVANQNKLIQIRQKIQNQKRNINFDLFDYGSNIQTALIFAVQTIKNPAYKNLIKLTNQYEIILNATLFPTIKRQYKYQIQNSQIKNSQAENNSQLFHYTHKNLYKRQVHSIEQYLGNCFQGIQFYYGLTIGRQIFYKKSKAIKQLSKTKLKNNCLLNMSIISLSSAVGIFLNLNLWVFGCLVSTLMVLNDSKHYLKANKNQCCDQHEISYKQFYSIYNIVKQTMRQFIIGQISEQKFTQIMKMHKANEIFQQTLKLFKQEMREMFAVNNNQIPNDIITFSKNRIQLQTEVSHLIGLFYQEEQKKVKQYIKYCYFKKKIQFYQMCFMQQKQNASHYPGVLIFQEKVYRTKIIRIYFPIKKQKQMQKLLTDQNLFPFINKGRRNIGYKFQLHQKIKKKYKAPYYVIGLQLCDSFNKLAFGDNTIANWLRLLIPINKKLNVKVIEIGYQPIQISQDDQFYEEYQQKMQELVQ